MQHARSSGTSFLSRTETGKDGGTEARADFEFMNIVHPA
jgi:hypothetical protein